MKLWAVAGLAAGLSFYLKRTLGTAHPLPLAVVVLGLYSSLYAAGTYALRVEEARNTLITIRRRLRIG